MTLEQISERMRVLHERLSFFSLPAPLRAEIQAEMEALAREVRETRAERMWEAALCDEPLLHVVNTEDITRFEKNNLAGDKELERRNGQLVKRLRERGEFRKLRKLPADWQKRLFVLERQFPNFDEPIEYLRASLFASGRRDQSIHWGPMAFEGPPGSGKTTFCEALAEALGLPFCRIDMASAQSSANLSGSDVFWANTRPGKLATEVLLGDVANPLLILDEMDKAHGDDRYPAINSLYPLLEERTARRFEDLSIPGVPFDTSRVLWAGSMNSAELLDGPIRDRLRIFSIKPPSPDAMRRIVTTTFDAVLRDLGLTRRDVSLTASAIAQLTELPPRRMKRTIMENVALTALRRRRRLEISGTGNGAKRHRIGFV